MYLNVTKNRQYSQLYMDNDNVVYFFKLINKTQYQKLQYHVS